MPPRGEQPHVSSQEAKPGAEAKPQRQFLQQNPPAPKIMMMARVKRRMGGDIELGDATGDLARRRGR